MGCISKGWNEVRDEFREEEWQKSIEVERTFHIYGPQNTCTFVYISAELGSRADDRLGVENKLDVQ